MKYILAIMLTFSMVAGTVATAQEPTKEKAFVSKANPKLKLAKKKDHSKKAVVKKKQQR